MKNIEFKASIPELHHAVTVLSAMKAYHKGTAVQEDIYFKVPEGRLKLRLSEKTSSDGNTLIAYHRDDTDNTKKSTYDLLDLRGEGDGKTITDILTKALGIKVMVKKTRSIYLVGLAKIHLDTVENLDGYFIEIEIRDPKHEFTDEYLQTECDRFQKMLGVPDSDKLKYSYSDMVYAKTWRPNLPLEQALKEIGD